jgi:uncharacterized protein (TIGR02996 family)
MTDGDALQRAVVANRDDDTPRLIYADWCDENGQPHRASFIRAQIESARAEPYSTAARLAKSRGDRFLNLHKKEWTRHLNGNFVEEPRFQRGFISHVRVEPLSIASITALFDVEPLQSFRFVRARDGERRTFLSLFEMPQLSQIHELELIELYDLEHDEYMALLTSPNLAGIRKLSLRGSAVQPSWFVEMWTSGAFPNLTSLDVADITNLGPSLLQAFNKATQRELKSFDATGIKIKSELLQQVLASPCLCNVEELKLGFSGLPGQQGPLFELDIGWVIPWTRLVLLDLSGQLLGDDAVRAIAFQDEARALRWLGLANNDLGADAVRLLTKCTNLSLHYLDVRGNRFNHMAIAALKERFSDALILS